MAIMVLSRTAGAGANLLPNASFEEGATGWTLWRASPETSGGAVSEESARHGRRCFKVENRGSGGANLFSEPIPAGGEQDFTLSVYARTEKAKGVRIGLWAVDAGGKTRSYSVGHPVELPADQLAWARFKSVVRTPPDCAGLKAHLVCNGGTVWWDAVQVERGRDAAQFRAVSPMAGRRNLLSNSGFEDGELDWSLWRQFPTSSSGGAVAGEGRNGGSAFRVVNPSRGGANLHSEPVPCEPNTVYTISVYARVKDGARAPGARIQIAGWGLDKAQKVLHYVIGEATSLPANVNEYARFSATFTTPPDCAFLKAHLICNGGEVWWDDCQLERGDQAAEYEAGPRADVLPKRRGPLGVAYTRAIIREARLRDALAQTERLALYSGADKLRTGLDEARQSVERISRTLGAPYLVPDYLAVDYAALDGLMEQAEKQLASLWSALGHRADDVFRVWRPRLDGAPDVGRAPDRKQLAQEFFIFPCFTRDYFFKDESFWPLLEPFGFRIVSGWWGAGVRFSPEGQLNPQGLDAAVAACRERGYACDVCVDGATGAVDALKDRLGEAIYLHNAEGDWSPAGNCHNTINIWHPEVRRAAADYLSKLAAYYAKNPAIIAYELTNEPSLTIEKHEHGYKYKPIGAGCYSPSARQAWKSWLEKKYRTIAALNARWRTSYAAFEEAQPPTDLAPPAPQHDKAPVLTGPIHDFQSFRAESHADWFRHCIEAMRAGDPDRAVVSQFVSGPMDRKEAAVDLRRMAEDAPWDFYGTHDWPGDRPAAASLYAVSMNRKADRPHWEDEFIWSQWERKGTPEPVMRAALERNLWRQIAWGKRGISLFNLESEWLHDAPANWNNSLLNIEADLEVPRYCAGVIPAVERKTHLFKDVLYRTRIAPTGIAILRPTAATLVSAPDKATRQEGTFVADYLLARHEMPIMIPEEHLLADSSWRDRVSVLVAPWAVNLPEAVQDEMLRWIEAGGSLFATGPVGLFDEYGKPSAILLKRTVGERAWRFDAEKGSWAADQPPAPAGFGKGRVFVCAERLSAAKDAAPLQKVLDEVAPLRYVHTDLAKLEIIPRVDGDGGEFLFIINLDATSPREGEVRVRGVFGEVLDLSCEPRPSVPVRRDGETTVIPVQLQAGGAVFLSLRAGAAERTKSATRSEP